ncbi:MAG: hypothetical protein RIG66_15265 [Coleofasciculus sp. E2-BRE-01]
MAKSSSRLKTTHTKLRSIMSLESEAEERNEASLQIRTKSYSRSLDMIDFNFDYLSAAKCYY